MTEDISIWQFRRGIRKAKKKLERKHAEDFTPYRASLRLMCEKYALPEYFTPIRNRIYREADENELKMDYIYINLNDLEDIYLDSTSIIAFWDILKGYFDIDFLRDFRHWLSAVNEEEEFYFNFTKAIRTAKISQLKEHQQSYEKYNEVYKTDMCDRLLSLVNAELNHRKKFRFIKIKT